MGKHLLFGALMFGVLLVTATSRSDSGSTPSLPSGATAEPITGSEATSAPGGATVRHDPFTFYDVGPPGTKTWSLSDLAPAEQAAATNSHDTTNWSQVQSGWAAAVQARAHQAAAAAAAHQLGIGDLGSTGVVP